MSDANIFGPIMSPKKIERGVAAALDYWLTDYLGELERIEGYEPNAIQRPRGVITLSEFAKWPENQLPVVMIMNSGLTGPPIRRGDGTHDCSWLIGIAAVVSANSFDATRDLAGTYGAAIRAAILQHKMLASPVYPDGFATNTVWHDETYGDLNFEETRTLGSARVIFEVSVNGVVTEAAGPRVPLADPAVDPGPWPQVEEADVNVTPISIGAAL